jgi:hypothetical protein
MAYHNFDFFTSPITPDYKKVIDILNAIEISSDINFNHEIEYMHYDFEQDILRDGSHSKRYVYHGEKNKFELARWLADFNNRGSYSFNIKSDKKNYEFYFETNYMDLNISVYSICVDISPWFMDNETQNDEKLNRFDDLFILLNNISKPLNPFYGFAYVEQFEKAYVQDYIIPGKARFPFDLTFWGKEYPSKPNAEAQRMLIETGYIVKNTEQGVWLYYSPDKWYTNEYWKALHVAEEILNVDEKEGTYR